MSSTSDNIDNTELEKALEYCKKAQKERIIDMKIHDLTHLD